MDREAVKQYLQARGMAAKVAEMSMKEADGLEDEGWTISVEMGRLVFTTPTLTWWGNGVTSSSRYRMIWSGGVGVYAWQVIALDRKPHWPMGMHHPNIGTTPCMGIGDGNHPSIQQPDPFVAARSIASMISGPVLSPYEPQKYGDVQSDPNRICGRCWD